MADSQSRAGIQAAVALIDQQIEELRRAKKTLLGLPLSPGVDTSAQVSPSGAPIIGDPLIAVREQEFSGMSIAKAAEAFLRKIGRHEKTQTIIAAVQKGGVEVRGKSPMSTVYTTLSRRPAFVSLKKNYWDLAERRPDMVQEKKHRPKSKVLKRGGQREKRTIRALPAAAAPASA